MRNVPKNYHDENYWDPVPAGICPMCGEPVYPGDLCYISDEGPIHANSEYRIYRHEKSGTQLIMSCAMAYTWDNASQEDMIEAMAEAIGLQKKVW